MRYFCTFFSLALFLFLVGCASPRLTTHTDAPDGIYIEAVGDAPRYAMRVIPPEGGAKTFCIQPYDGFTPKSVVVFDSPDGYYVQVDGQATAENWSKDGIFLVINHKAYSGLTKSGQAIAATGERFGPSATISQVLPTRAEADAVVSALRRRYPWISP